MRIFGRGVSVSVCCNWIEHISKLSFLGDRAMLPCRRGGCSWSLCFSGVSPRFAHRSVLPGRGSHFEMGLVREKQSHYITWSRLVSTSLFSPLMFQSYETGVMGTRHHSNLLNSQAWVSCAYEYSLWIRLIYTSPHPLYTGVKFPVSYNWELSERKMGGILKWLKRSSWRESRPRTFLLGIRGERLLWIESVWNECFLCSQEGNHLALLMWKLIYPLHIKATPFLKYPLKYQSHCALRICQSAVQFGTFSTSLQGRKKSPPTTGV